MALLFPAIIGLAVWFYGNQEQRGEDVERAALEVARQMIDLSDSELNANSRILALLGDSPALGSGDLNRWQQFIERSTRQTPDWRAVMLRRAGGPALLAETATQTDNRPLRPLPASVPREGLIEGVFREGRYCPCVIIHRRAAVDPNLVLTLYLDPLPFQRIMRRKTPPGAVGAIVDREGRFAGRSIDYEERVGTAATNYVRRAISEGERGFYRGVTFEGFENYTAFVASPVTGWSAHAAVDRSAVDSPRSWSNVATATGILAVLALAAGLSLYAIYEMRARRRDEQRFLEAQKAEAIGQFTGTAVHDFRNIIAVVDAGLNLITRQRTKAQIGEIVAELRETLGRGERLTNQLLSFVRGDGAEIRTIDLQTLLEKSEEMLRRALGPEIDFSWKVAENARYARANADQLELALLNLAINARDALAGPGRFAIAATRERDRVVIAVSDDGPGIPPHRRDDVFALYYSTKPAGKGTGLGLAQVAGAMRQAEGRVKVDDNPGGGTRFLLSLKAGLRPKDDEPAA